MAACIGVDSYGDTELAATVATVGGGGKSAVLVAGPPVGRRLRFGELQAAPWLGDVVVGEHDRDAPGTRFIRNHPSRQRGCSGASDGDNEKDKPLLSQNRQKHWT